MQYLDERHPTFMISAAAFKGLVGPWPMGEHLSIRLVDEQAKPPHGHCSPASVVHGV
jgi:hypothetical protein